MSESLSTISRAEDFLARNAPNSTKGTLRVRMLSALWMDIISNANVLKVSPSTKRWLKRKETWGHLMSLLSAIDEMERNG